MSSTRGVEVHFSEAAPQQPPRAKERNAKTQGMPAILTREAQKKEIVKSRHYVRPSRRRPPSPSPSPVSLWVRREAAAMTVIRRPAKQLKLHTHCIISASCLGEVRKAFILIVL